jgi:hypothetical protein
MPKSQENPWIFLINLETTPTFFKLVTELYHNQFSKKKHKDHQIFANVVISKY